MNWLGMENTTGSISRYTIIFTFSLIVFVRIGFMMFYLLKRKIPWEESIAIPMAFALYYVGFALLVLPNQQPIDFLDYFGILLFLFGSFINTYSELQRHFWKNRPENKGKLYTQGLFSYAMHVNYFGDVCWVTACAIITRNWYAVLIPVFLLCFFIFYNIPKLDQYLASKYGEAFDLYRRQTKKLTPFIY